MLPENGPFQTKSLFKVVGLFQRFPHDGRVAPEMKFNTALVPISRIHFVCGGKCYQETKVVEIMAALILAQFQETCSHYSYFAFGFHLQLNWGLKLFHKASIFFGLRTQFSLT